MSLTKRVLETFDIPQNAPVKWIKSGNVLEIQYMSKRNTKATIKMLEGGLEYIDLSTGEIKEVEKHNTRADQKQSLFRTFQRLRQLINCNCTDVKKIRWCTLTYAENMMDTKKLYKDFELFYKRLCYFCVNHNWCKPKYISVCEPQGRGAWHIHVLLIFEDMKYAPFIHYSKFAELWGCGGVDIRTLNGTVDNVGAYLTAYLADMPVDEVKKAYDNVDLHREIKEIEVDNGKGKLVKKRIVKGARLPLYPANFNIYRSSRGLKEPEIYMTNYDEDCIKKIGSAKPTFQKSVHLSDDTTGFDTIVSSLYYNLSSHDSQGN